MTQPRIVFLGTPEFAVPSLEILVRNRYPVVGVVTQPDRPRGRGKHTAPPPVKAFAEAQRLGLLQPERVKEVFTGTASDLRRDRYFQGAGLVDLMRAIQSV